MTTANVPAGPLSPAQLDSFKINGFLHIPGLIPAHELKAVQDDTWDLIQKGLETQLDDPTYCYGADASDKGRKCLFRINHLLDHHGHASFKLLLAYPPLLQAVAQAVGNDHFASTVHSTVFKIPHRGYPVPWHQDPVQVRRWPVFNVDIYLDEANPDNGGLYVIPGSHLAGFHGSREFVESWTQGKEEDAPGAIPVLTQPGDVLFHSTTVLHGSFWNRSNSLRRTIYFHIDHWNDVTLQDAENWNGRHNYDRCQQLMLEAVQARRAQYPDEAAFDYRLIDIETGQLR